MAPIANRNPVNARGWKSASADLTTTKLVPQKTQVATSNKSAEVKRQFNASTDKQPFDRVSLDSVHTTSGDQPRFPVDVVKPVTPLDTTLNTIDRGNKQFVPLPLCNY